MRENFIARKSQKSEKIWMTLTLLLGIIHMTIFGLTILFFFNPNFNKDVGMYLGMFGGVAVLVLFIISYTCYIMNKNLPPILIEEKEEGFFLRGGKEYCRFDNVSKVCAKPFLFMKTPDNFGTIILMSPAGNKFKVKWVADVMNAEKEINRIIMDRSKS